MLTVIAQLTRRAIGLGVSIFATLGFMAVPLGDKTGFQHAKAIVLSNEARRFAEDLSVTAARLKNRLLTELVPGKLPSDRLQVSPNTNEPKERTLSPTQPSLQRLSPTQPLYCLPEPLNHPSTSRESRARK